MLSRRRNDHRSLGGLARGLVLGMAMTASAVAADQEGSKVVSLTPANYDELTAGKTVFIKFYAPWCGHCQELAPTWERLAAVYAGHDKYLVGEVDCDTEKETNQWCADVMEVEGFPTMLFGDPGRDGALLEEYMDDRDFETLSAFAAQMFATPLCNADHMEGCDDATKADLQRYWKMTENEIDAEMERIEEEMDQIEEDYEESIEELQEQYDDMATDHSILVAKITKEVQWMREAQEQKLLATS